MMTTQSSIAEHRAFKLWRIIKRIVGFGSITLVLDESAGEEWAHVDCHFRTGRGLYVVNVAYTLYSLSMMDDNHFEFIAAAEGERIRLQLKDGQVGIIAANAKPHAPTSRRSPHSPRPS